MSCQADSSAFSSARLIGMIVTEILFYHLEQQALEQVLPILLEKTLQRGWRAVVQARSEERLDMLDAHLWTYRDDSFLAHGTRREGGEADQPIFLTLDESCPNGATVRFYVDRAQPGDVSAYERAVYLFDGRDMEAVQEARVKWKDVKAAGHVVTYWQQDHHGRWERKA